MSNVENLRPVAKSIRETGAVAGDLVRCVSSDDPRYSKGQIYVVVSWFGRPHILAGGMIAPTKEEKKTRGDALPNTDGRVRRALAQGAR